VYFKLKNVDHFDCRLKTSSMKFCSNCGAALAFRIPEGDKLHRYVCGSCHTIHYQNPRIIVGCLPVRDSSVLLCRRSIDPGCGLWTLPSGFMENGEILEDGARRETLEEANASVEIIDLHCIYSIPHISQVYLIFLAELSNMNFSPGEETLEVRLFREEEVPWEEIAFSSIDFALRCYYEDIKNHTRLLHRGSYS